MGFPSVYRCKSSSKTTSVQFLEVLTEGFALSVQFCPLTNGIMEGTWRTIQQGSSADPFCRRPLWAVLAWADMSALWCCPSGVSSADHSVAHCQWCPEWWFWKGCHGVWHVQTMQGGPVPICDIFQSSYHLMFGLEHETGSPFAMWDGWCLQKAKGRVKTAATKRLCPKLHVRTSILFHNLNPNLEPLIFLTLWKKHYHHQTHHWPYGKQYTNPNMS